MPGHTASDQAILKEIQEHLDEKRRERAQGPTPTPAPEPPLTPATGLPPSRNQPGYVHPTPATGPLLLGGTGTMAYPPPPETVGVESTVPVTTGVLPKFLRGPIESTTQYMGEAWGNFSQGLSILSEYAGVGLEGMRRLSGADTGYGLPIFNLRSQPPPGEFTGDAIDPRTGHPIPRPRPLHPRGFGTDLEQGKGLLDRQERTKRAEESAKLFSELFYAALDPGKKAEIRAKIAAAHEERSFWEKVTLGLLSPENLLFLGAGAAKAFKAAANAFSPPVITTGVSSRPAVQKLYGALLEVKPLTKQRRIEQSKEFGKRLGTQVEEAKRLREEGRGAVEAFEISTGRFRGPLLEESKEKPFLSILEGQGVTVPTEGATVRLATDIPRTVPTEGAALTLPRVVRELMVAGREVTGRQVLDNPQVEELKVFLQKHGANPKDDLSIGLIEKTKEGTDQIILGSYIAPISKERNYVKFRPSDSTFTVGPTRTGFPGSVAGDEAFDPAVKLYDEIYGTVTSPGEAAARLGGATGRGAAAGLGDAAGRTITQVTTKEADELMEMALMHNMNRTEQLNNQDAVYRLFFSNTPPQHADVGRLEQIFGSDIATEAIRIGGLGPGMWDRVMDISNIPRALWASNDLSGTFRQGRLLGNGNPKEWKDSTVAAMKAMGSERNARAIQESIEQNPLYDLLKQSKVQITKRGGVATQLVDREEAFMSSIASSIPWVRVSERAMVTQLNKLRSDVFYKIASDWLEGGKTFATHEKDFLALGQYINWTTGRGPWPERFNAVLPFMNAIFFSPRLNTSRAATAALLLKPAVRGMIAKDLLAFFTTNATILMLAEASGIATVAWDPGKKDFLSADFGKLQRGPTRFDFWGGYQQFAVLGGRMVMGEKKTAGGSFEGVPFLDTLSDPQRAISSRAKFIYDYLLFKASPAVSIGKTIITGEMPLGDPATPSNLAREHIPLLGGMAIASIAEAVRVLGWTGGALAMPEVVGLGVQTYYTLGQVKNEASMRDYGIPYNDLTNFKDKEAIDNDPTVQAYYNDMEARKGTLQQQLERERTPEQQYRQGILSMNIRNQTLESDLRDILDTGVSGKKLREAISAFKTGRYHSFETAMSEEAREELKESSDLNLLNSWRSQYWAVQAKIKETEEGTFLDYDAREAGREKIVREAAAEGIDRESLEDRSSRRFEDPEVQRVVEEYETAIHFLRPYFDVARRLIGNDNIYAMYLDMPQKQWPRSLKQIAKKIKLHREDMRKQSPRLDGMLKKWGFTTYLINERGR